MDIKHIYEFFLGTVVMVDQKFEMENCDVIETQVFENCAGTCLTISFSHNCRRILNTTLTSEKHYDRVYSLGSCRTEFI
jgi:hypothetical protein